MGIVFSHTVAAGLYYFRNGRSLVLDQPLERNGQHQCVSTNQNKHDLSDISGDTAEQRSECLQNEDTYASFITEALMPVLDASNLTELREAIKLTISRCVLNTQLVKVFLRDPLTSHLVDEHCRPLPNSRFISDILHQKGKTVVTVNHNQDSIRELLGGQHSTDNNHSVLLLPIPERGTQKNIGLIVVVSQAGSLSSVDPKRIELCLKQISITYEVVKNSLLKDSGPPHISNLLSLIHLCGELNDPDAAKLEIKVVRYLQRQTDAESGFLLLVVPETQMLFCQAVGDTVLEEEIRFAGPSSCFAKALESKQPITLADIPMERRHEVEKIIRRQINSLLCVPVCVTDSKDLLALACMVNKCNHDQFNQEDIETILQCFRYTATVLTSTLAFQNERKLKNQTQALLQVARKLFTRLDPLLDQNSDAASPERVRLVSPGSSSRTGNSESEKHSPSPKLASHEGYGARSSYHAESQSVAELLNILPADQAQNTLVVLPLSAFKGGGLLRAGGEFVEAASSASKLTDSVSVRRCRLNSESSSEYSTASSCPPSPELLGHHAKSKIKSVNSPKYSNGTTISGSLSRSAVKGNKTPAQVDASAINLHSERKLGSVFHESPHPGGPPSNTKKMSELEFARCFFNNLEHFEDLLGSVHGQRLLPALVTQPRERGTAPRLSDSLADREIKFPEFRSGISSSFTLDYSSCKPPAFKRCSSCQSGTSASSGRKSTSPGCKKSIRSSVRARRRNSISLQRSNMEIFAHTSHEGFEADVSIRKRPRRASTRQSRSMSNSFAAGQKTSPVARKKRKTLIKVKAAPLYQIVKPSAQCGVQDMSDDCSFHSVSEDETDRDKTDDSSLQRLISTLQDVAGSRDNKVPWSLIAVPKPCSPIVSQISDHSLHGPQISPVEIHRDKNETVSEEDSPWSESLDEDLKEEPCVSATLTVCNTNNGQLMTKVPLRRCLSLKGDKDTVDQLAGEGDHVTLTSNTDPRLLTYDLTHTRQGDSTDANLSLFEIHMNALDDERMNAAQEDNNAVSGADFNSVPTVSDKSPRFDQAGHKVRHYNDNNDNNPDYFQDALQGQQPDALDTVRTEMFMTSLCHVDSIGTIEVSADPTFQVTDRPVSLSVPDPTFLSQNLHDFYNDGISIGTPLLLAAGGNLGDSTDSVEEIDEWNCEQDALSSTDSVLLKVRHLGDSSSKILDWGHVPEHQGPGSSGKGLPVGAPVSELNLSHTVPKDVSLNRDDENLVCDSIVDPEPIDFDLEPMESEGISIFWEESFLCCSEGHSEMDMASERIPTATDHPNCSISESGLGSCDLCEVSKLDFADEDCETDSFFDEAVNAMEDDSYSYTADEDTDSSDEVFILASDCSLVEELSSCHTQEVETCSGLNKENSKLEETSPGCDARYEIWSGYNESNKTDNDWNKTGFELNETKYGVNVPNKTEYGVGGLHETGYGVSGLNETEYGVIGQYETGYGVNGLNETGYGVSGLNETGYGVSGLNETRYGVSGLNETGYGVNGLNETRYGVSGLNETGYGVSGLNETRYGVSGLNETISVCNILSKAGSLGHGSNETSFVYNTPKETGPGISELIETHSNFSGLNQKIYISSELTQAGSGFCNGWNETGWVKESQATPTVRSCYLTAELDSGSTADLPAHEAGSGATDLTDSEHLFVAKLDWTDEGGELNGCDVPPHCEAVLTCSEGSPAEPLANNVDLSLSEDTKLLLTSEVNHVKTFEVLPESLSGEVKVYNENYTSLMMVYNENYTSLMMSGMNFNEESPSHSARNVSVTAKSHHISEDTDLILDLNLNRAAYFLQTGDKKDANRTEEINLNVIVESSHLRTSNEIDRNHIEHSLDIQTKEQKCLNVEEEPLHLQSGDEIDLNQIEESHLQALDGFSIIEEYLFHINDGSDLNLLAESHLQTRDGNDLNLIEESCLLNEVEIDVKKIEEQSLKSGDEIDLYLVKDLDLQSAHEINMNLFEISHLQARDEIDVNVIEEPHEETEDEINLNLDDLKNKNELSMNLIQGSLWKIRDEFDLNLMEELQLQTRRGLDVNLFEESPWKTIDLCAESFSLNMDANESNSGQLKTAVDVERVIIESGPKTLVSDHLTVAGSSLHLLHEDAPHIVHWLGCDELKVSEDGIEEITVKYNSYAESMEETVLPVHTGINDDDLDCLKIFPEIPSMFETVEDIATDKLDENAADKLDNTAEEIASSEFHRIAEGIAIDKLDEVLEETECDDLDAAAEEILVYRFDKTADEIPIDSFDETAVDKFKDIAVDELEDIAVGKLEEIAVDNLEEIAVDKLEEIAVDKLEEIAVDELEEIAVDKLEEIAGEKAVDKSIEAAEENTMDKLDETAVELASDKFHIVAGEITIQKLDRTTNEKDFEILEETAKEKEETAENIASGQLHGIADVDEFESTIIDEINSTAEEIAVDMLDKAAQVIPSENSDEAMEEIYGGKLIEEKMLGMTEEIASVKLDEAAREVTSDTLKETTEKKLGENDRDEMYRSFEVKISEMVKDDKRKEVEEILLACEVRKEANEICADILWETIDGLLKHECKYKTSEEIDLNFFTNVEDMNVIKKLPENEQDEGLIGIGHVQDEGLIGIGHVQDEGLIGIGHVQDEGLIGIGHVQDEGLIGIGHVQDEGLMEIGHVHDEGLMGIGHVQDEGLIGIRHVTTKCSPQESPSTSVIHLKDICLVDTVRGLSVSNSVLTAEEIESDKSDIIAGENVIDKLDTTAEEIATNELHRIAHGIDIDKLDEVLKIKWGEVDVAVDRFDDNGVDKFKDIAVDELEHIAVDKVEDIAVDKLKDITVDKLEDFAVDKFKDIAVDKLEEIAVDKLEDIAVEELEDIAVDKLEYITVDKLEKSSSTDLTSVPHLKDTCIVDTVRGLSVTDSVLKSHCTACSLSDGSCSLNSHDSLTTHDTPVSQGSYIRQSGETFCHSPEKLTSALSPGAFIGHYSPDEILVAETQSDVRRFEVDELKLGKRILFDVGLETDVESSFLYGERDLQNQRLEHYEMISQEIETMAVSLVGVSESGQLPDASCGIFSNVGHVGLTECSLDTRVGDCDTADIVEPDRCFLENQDLLLSEASMRKLLPAVTSYSDHDVAIGFFTRQHNLTFDDRSLSLPDICTMTYSDNRSQNSNRPNPFFSDGSDTLTCCSVPSFRICDRHCAANAGFRKVKSEHNLLSPPFMPRSSSQVYLGNVRHCLPMSPTGSDYSDLPVHDPTCFWSNNISAEARRILEEYEQRRRSVGHFDMHQSHSEPSPLQQKFKSSLQCSKVGLITDRLEPFHCRPSSSVMNGDLLVPELVPEKKMFRKDGNASRLVQSVRNKLHASYAKSADILKSLSLHDDSQEQEPLSSLAWESSGKNFRATGDYKFFKSPPVDSAENVDELSYSSPEACSIFSCSHSHTTGGNLCQEDYHSYSLFDDHGNKPKHDDFVNSDGQRYVSSRLSKHSLEDDVSKDSTNYYLDSKQPVYTPGYSRLGKSMSKQSWMTLSPPRKSKYGRLKFNQDNFSDSEVTNLSVSHDTYESPANSLSATSGKGHRVTFVDEKTNVFSVGGAGEGCGSSASDSSHRNSADEGSDQEDESTFASAKYSGKARDPGRSDIKKPASKSFKSWPASLGPSKTRQKKTGSSCSREDTGSESNVQRTEELESSQSLGPWNLNIKVLLQVGNEKVEDKEGDKSDNKLRIKSLTSQLYTGDFGAYTAGSGSCPADQSSRESLDRSQASGSSNTKEDDHNMNLGLMPKKYIQQKYQLLPEGRSQMLEREDLSTVLELLDEEDQETDSFEYTSRDVYSEDSAGCLMGEGQLCSGSASEGLDSYLNGPDDDALTSARIDRLSVEQDEEQDDLSEDASSDYVSVEAEKITHVTYRKRDEDGLRAKETDKMKNVEPGRQKSKTLDHLQSARTTIPEKTSASPESSRLTATSEPHRSKRQEEKLIANGQTKTIVKENVKMNKLVKNTEDSELENVKSCSPEFDRTLLELKMSKALLDKRLQKIVNKDTRHQNGVKKCDEPLNVSHKLLESECATSSGTSRLNRPPDALSKENRSKDVKCAKTETQVNSSESATDKGVASVPGPQLIGSRHSDLINKLINHSGSKASVAQDGLKNNSESLNTVNSSSESKDTPISTPERHSALVQKLINRSTSYNVIHAGFKPIERCAGHGQPDDARFSGRDPPSLDSLTGSLGGRLDKKKSFDRPKKDVTQGREPRDIFGHSPLSHDIPPGSSLPGDDLTKDSNQMDSIADRTYDVLTNSSSSRNDIKIYSPPQDAQPVNIRHHNVAVKELKPKEITTKTPGEQNTLPTSCASHADLIMVSGLQDAPSLKSRSKEILPSCSRQHAVLSKSTGASEILTDHANDQHQRETLNAPGSSSRTDDIQPIRHETESNKCGSLKVSALSSSPKFSRQTAVVDENCATSEARNDKIHVTCETRHDKSHVPCDAKNDTLPENAICSPPSNMHKPLKKQDLPKISAEKEMSLNALKTVKTSNRQQNEATLSSRPHSVSLPRQNDILTSCDTAQESQVSGLKDTFILSRKSHSSHERQGFESRPPGSAYAAFISKHASPKASKPLVVWSQSSVGQNSPLKGPRSYDSIANNSLQNVPTLSRLQGDPVRSLKPQEAFITTSGPRGAVVAVPKQLDADITTVDLQDALQLSRHQGGQPKNSHPRDAYISIPRQQDAVSTKQGPQDAISTRQGPLDAVCTRQGPQDDGSNRQELQDAVGAMQGHQKHLNSSYRTSKMFTSSSHLNTGLQDNLMDSSRPQNPPSYRHVDSGSRPLHAVAHGPKPVHTYSCLSYGVPSSLSYGVPSVSSGHLAVLSQKTDITDDFSSKPDQTFTFTPRPEDGHFFQEVGNKNSHVFSKPVYGQLAENAYYVSSQTRDAYMTEEPLIVNYILQEVLPSTSKPQVTHHCRSQSLFTNCSTPQVTLMGSPTRQNGLGSCPKPGNVLIRSPTPGDVLIRSPRLQNVQGRSPRPQNVQGRSPRPENVLGRSPRPAIALGRNHRPKNVLGRNPRPQKVWGRSPRSENVMGRSHRPHNVLGRSPRPQNVLGRSPRPQNVLACSSRPAIALGGSPRSENVLGRSPRPENVFKQKYGPHNVLRKSPTAQSMSDIPRPHELLSNRPRPQYISTSSSQAENYLTIGSTPHGVANNSPGSDNRLSRSPGPQFVRNDSRSRKLMTSGSRPHEVLTSCPAPQTVRGNNSRQHVSVCSPKAADTLMDSPGKDVLKSSPRPHIVSPKSSRLKYSPARSSNDLINRSRLPVVLTNIPRHQNVLSGSPRGQNDLSSSPRGQNDLSSSPRGQNDLSSSPGQRKDLSNSPRQQNDLSVSPRQQNALSISPRQQSALRSSPRQQNALSSSPRQQNALSRSPRQQNALSSSPKQQNALSRSPRQYNALSSSPRQQNALSSSPRQQNALSSSPRQQNALRSNPRQMNALRSSPKQQNSLSSNPRQQNALRSSPKQHNSLSSAPRQQNALRSSPKQHNSLSSAPRQQNALSNSSRKSPRLQKGLTEGSRPLESQSVDVGEPEAISPIHNSFADATYNVKPADHNARNVKTQRQDNVRSPASKNPLIKLSELKPQPRKSSALKNVNADHGGLADSAHSDLHNETIDRRKVTNVVLPVLGEETGSTIVSAKAVSRIGGHAPVSEQMNDVVSMTFNKEININEGAADGCTHLLADSIETKDVDSRSYKKGKVTDSGCFYPDEKYDGKTLEYETKTCDLKWKQKINSYKTINDRRSSNENEIKPGLTQADIHKVESYPIKTDTHRFRHLCTKSASHDGVSLDKLVAKLGQPMASGEIITTEENPQSKSESLGSMPVSAGEQNLISNATSVGVVYSCEHKNLEITSPPKTEKNSLMQLLYNSDISLKEVKLVLLNNSLVQADTSSVDPDTLCRTDGSNLLMEDEGKDVRPPFCPPKKVFRKRNLALDNSKYSSRLSSSVTTLIKSDFLETSLNHQSHRLWTVSEAELEEDLSFKSACDLTDKKRQSSTADKLKEKISPMMGDYHSCSSDSDENHSLWMSAFSLVDETKPEQAQAGGEWKSSGGESFVPDMTDCDESNLSSDDDTRDADISSLESVLHVPVTPDKVRLSQPLKYHFLSQGRASHHQDQPKPKFIFHVDADEVDVLVHNSNVVKFEIPRLQNEDTDGCPADVESLSDCVWTGCTKAKREPVKSAARYERCPSFFPAYLSTPPKQVKCDELLTHNMQSLSSGGPEKYDSLIIAKQGDQNMQHQGRQSNIQKRGKLYSPPVSPNDVIITALTDGEDTLKSVQLESVYYTDSMGSMEEDDWLACETPLSSIRSSNLAAYINQKKGALKCFPRKKLFACEEPTTMERNWGGKFTGFYIGANKELNNANNNDIELDCDAGRDFIGLSSLEDFTGQMQTQADPDGSGLIQGMMVTDTGCAPQPTAKVVKKTVCFQLPGRDCQQLTDCSCLNDEQADPCTQRLEINYEPFISEPCQSQTRLPVIVEESEESDSDNSSDSMVMSFSSSETFTDEEVKKNCSSQIIQEVQELVQSSPDNDEDIRRVISSRYFPDLSFNTCEMPESENTYEKAEVVEFLDKKFEGCVVPNFGFTPEPAEESWATKTDASSGDRVFHDNLSDDDLLLEVNICLESSESSPASSLTDDIGLDVLNQTSKEFDESIHMKQVHTEFTGDMSQIDCEGLVFTECKDTTHNNDIMNQPWMLLSKQVMGLGTAQALPGDEGDEAEALLRRLKEMDCILQTASDQAWTCQSDVLEESSSRQPCYLTCQSDVPEESSSKQLCHLTCQSDVLEESSSRQSCHLTCHSDVPEESSSKQLCHLTCQSNMPEESSSIQSGYIDISNTVYADPDTTKVLTFSSIWHSGHESNISPLCEPDSGWLSRPASHVENDFGHDENSNVGNMYSQEEANPLSEYCHLEHNWNETSSQGNEVTECDTNYATDLDHLTETSLSTPDETKPAVKDDANDVLDDLEDDMNASSEAYSDNLERLGSSYEHLGEDSAGSHSDSDILLHTSSRICDPLVLKKLRGNAPEKNHIPCSKPVGTEQTRTPADSTCSQAKENGSSHATRNSHSLSAWSSRESHLVDELELAAFLSDDCSVKEGGNGCCLNCSDFYEEMEHSKSDAEDGRKYGALIENDMHPCKNEVNNSGECLLILSEGLDSSGSQLDWPDVVTSHGSSDYYYHLYFDTPGSGIDNVSDSLDLSDTEDDLNSVDSKDDDSKDNDPKIKGSKIHYLQSDPIDNPSNFRSFDRNIGIIKERLEDDKDDGSSQSGLLGQSDLCNPDDLFAVSSLSDLEMTVTETDHQGTSTCSAGFSFSDPKFCHCFTGEKKRYSSFITGSCHGLPKRKPDHAVDRQSLCRNWILHSDVGEFQDDGHPKSCKETISTVKVYSQDEERTNEQSPLPYFDLCPAGGQWLCSSFCSSTDRKTPVVSQMNESLSGFVEDRDKSKKLNQYAVLNESSQSFGAGMGNGTESASVQSKSAFTLPDLIRHLMCKDHPGTFGFSDDDLTKLLREIMQEARNLTDAERCSVFLLDKDSDELVAMVFDGITADDKEVQGEIRLPKTQGIAGHVATTGTLLNIRDAYSHPLFYRGIDDSTGFRTRNILCFPIKNEEGVVLGVAQLCNKKTFQYFTTFDEDIASAFAVYCCISISHSLMYKRLVDTQHRHRLANELMIFHINQQVPMEEVQLMADTPILPVTTFSVNFDSFDFAPRTMSESQTVLSCLSMFEDLGFLSRWRIKLDTLVRFLLMVKKGYRNPPYHNWMHAYAVTHFCYLLIKNLHLHNYLDDIELLALFVSCLCHDIDHRGTTNSFQVQSQSVLAALYSSEGSVMERHHLAQSMCILNTEGSNLFENLSSKEYQTVLDLMRDIILATDLAHHLRTVKDQEELAESDSYDRNNPKHKHILLCLLMTACDLSDQTKNWNNTKHIATLVYQEFFSQGDLEKALGKNPLEMMDRERACIPELQISFLDNIAAPVYKILARMFSEAQTPARNVEENRKHWVHIGQLLKLRHGNSTQAMSLEQIISIEEDVDELPANGDIHVNGR